MTYNFNPSIETQIRFRADLFKKEREGLEGEALTERENLLLDMLTEALTSFVNPAEYVVFRNGRITRSSENVKIVNMDEYHELDENEVVDYAIELDDLGLVKEAHEIREYFGFQHLPND